MAWTTPKVNFTTDDVFADSDINATNANIVYLKTKADEIVSDTGSFTLTFSTSIFTVEQTITVYYTISELSGLPGKVILQFPNLFATSQTTTGVNFVATESLVEALRPAGVVSRVIPIVVMDAGVIVLGTITIYNGGGVRFHVLTDTPFTNSGLKGFPSFVVSYNLD
jgi:hypothetical protein